MAKYKMIREQGFVEHWETVIEADSIEDAAVLFQQYCEENDPVVEAVPMLDDEDYEEVN